VTARESVSMSSMTSSPLEAGGGLCPGNSSTWLKSCRAFFVPRPTGITAGEIASLEVASARETPALPRQPLCRGEAASTLGTTTWHPLAIDSGDATRGMVAGIRMGGGHPDRHCRSRLNAALSGGTPNPQYQLTSGTKRVIPKQAQVKK